MTAGVEIPTVMDIALLVTLGTSGKFKRVWYTEKI
jgi:hypothetical protein